MATIRSRIPARNSEMEDTGCLIVFKLQKEMKSTPRAKFFSGLYGGLNKSNYGRYTYRRKGLLDEMPHIRLSRAVIIVRTKDKEKILEFLQDKACVEIREVILQKKDKLKLGIKQKS